MKPFFSNIVVRGGGDLATGTIHRLWAAGFPVIVLECAYPSAIRRQVSLCEAVYDGTAEVEGLRAVRITKPQEAAAVLESGEVPILVDPDGESISFLKPEIVIDAILAKRNLGTTREMAPLTIALGPGFTAGEDVDLVVETKRGHNLGRVLTSGSAAPNSGIPGVIEGYGAQRVVHASSVGIFRNVCKIGDIVKEGDRIAFLEKGEERVPVLASMPGLLRGLLRDGYPVTKGFKVADIDPRLSEYRNCFTISDKSRCIAGGVLEAVCHYFFKKD